MEARRAKTPAGGLVHDSRARRATPTPSLPINPMDSTCKGCQSTVALATVMVDWVWMMPLPISTAFSFSAGLLPSPMRSTHLFFAGVPPTVVPIAVALSQHWLGCRDFQTDQFRPRIFYWMGYGLGSCLISRRSCTGQAVRAGRRPQV
jgi:hypothetical protein